MHVIGVISDTHGLLRPEIPKIFKNVDLILHAGDIGRPEILQELHQIAHSVAPKEPNARTGYQRNQQNSPRTVLAGNDQRLDPRRIPFTDSCCE